MEPRLKETIIKEINPSLKEMFGAGTAGTLALYQHHHDHDHDPSHEEVEHSA